MRTGTRTGPYTRTIQVTTNDRAHQHASVTCEVLVQAALKVTPQVLSFGRLQRDTGSITKTVKLTRGDAGPIAPRVLDAGAPNATAQLREITPGEEYELDVTLSPPWPNGNIRGALTLETGIERSPRETITLAGMLQPRVVAEPRALRVVTRDVEQDVTAELQWDGTPGKILDVSTNLPGGTVDLETAPDGKQRVILHVPVGLDAGRRTGYSIRLMTDDRLSPSLQIPLYLIEPRKAGAQPARRMPAATGRASSTGASQ